jgi:hypothetical protein
MVNDLSGDLMANNTRAQEREFTFHDKEIRVANSRSCIVNLNNSTNTWTKKYRIIWHTTKNKIRSTLVRNNIVLY